MNNKYCTSLECRVFILGHSCEGESIVILLCDGDIVIYSCIVDSFIFEGKPAASYVLADYDIDMIDDLVWSHPHDDHSQGLQELVDQYFPEFIRIPGELHFLNTNSVSSYFLNYINSNFVDSYDRRRKRQSKVRSTLENMTLRQFDILVDGEIYPFKMFAIAPSDGKVRIDSILNNYNSLNEYSIVLVIELFDYCIMLTGDIQDSSVRIIKEEFCSAKRLKVPNVLKIPHHGSRGSLTFPSVYDDAGIVDISVTTAKRANGLPTLDALNMYERKSDQVYRIVPDSDGLAVFEIDADIVGADVKISRCQNYMIYHSSDNI